MQLQSELDMQAIDAVPEAPSVSRRKPVRSRKVTVRLTEELFDRLSAATARPGVGKSMVVESALERFLNPAPSIEDVVQERFDDMNARFDHLERDVRMMAETVALHARYHLSVMPPLPQSRQQEAAHRGDERFKVLAEQVDRRVRLHHPLIQETIERLNSAKRVESQPTMNAQESETSDNDQKAPAEGAAIDLAFSAAAAEGGSSIYFRLPN